MPSLADRMRQADRERIKGLSPAERIAEALALGQAGLRIYAAAHGLDLAEARRRLERITQAGRAPSRVMREIIE